MSLLIANTELVLWQDLVKMAEENCQVRLEIELESYLISLLIRYTNQPSLANQLFVKDFLQTVELDASYVRDNALRDIGDKCLIYSGLFPKAAAKKQVNISYFVQLGQSSYAHISKAATTIYRLLADQFVVLMDILQSIRPGFDLLPLEAYDQWQAVGSQRALRILRAYTKSIPLKRN